MAQSASTTVRYCERQVIKKTEIARNSIIISLVKTQKVIKFLNHHTLLEGHHEEAVVVNTIVVGCLSTVR